MLDSETKRRIDACRDILVGKVPDPKSQVEQITIALIYKFMDDMDAEAEELGGKRGFFAGDYARFGWARLMAPGLGGFEVLALYSEAIQTMNKNPGVPPLFRDIFKNAYLPYRDPETLKSFLKEINYFTYDHSERLGDAFEYLLSVLGSQGDAGQFRTPRHIIDFMVEVIDPKKNETILVPACGTAGFLISAWKHILKTNTSKATKNDIASGTADGRRDGNLLTPDERARLAGGIRGYDISPDMVRLSLVNLYLHGFTDPRIEEYDTLTSDEKWNEVADVILANPPFMSPKGGIKPHKRFSVQATRSEVLFVDYMAEHLTATGRAAIVVPEGIIFQSGTAYKALRQMLVQTSLVAVVSLPAGVFNPYSGVKTSILILDKRLHKQLDSVLFVKVGNDGFNLGAQRRAVVDSHLPEATRLLRGWITAPEKFEGDGVMAQAVTRVMIGKSGDFNLSGERYQVSNQRQNATHPLIPFQEVCTLEYGISLPKQIRLDGPYPVLGSNGITGYHNTFLLEGPSIVVGRKGSAGEVTFVAENCTPIDTTYYVKVVNPSICDIRYLFHVLKTLNLQSFKGGAGIPGLNRNDVYDACKIPLPPLEVQHQIVAEIEGYQKIIDGARQVLDNYKPHIVVKAAWTVCSLGDVCTQITDGTHQTPTYVVCGVPFLRVTDLTGSSDSKKFISKEEHAVLTKRCRPLRDDVLYSKNGTIGVAKRVDWDYEFSIFVSLALLKPKPEVVDPQYLETYLNSVAALAQAKGYSKSGTVTNLHLVEIRQMTIPLPDLPTQHAIVAEIKAEQALVNANCELIRRLEAKIKTTIDRVWSAA